MVMGHVISGVSFNQVGILLTWNVSQGFLILVVNFSLFILRMVLFVQDIGGILTTFWVAKCYKLNNIT